MTTQHLTPQNKPENIRQFERRGRTRNRFEYAVGAIVFSFFLGVGIATTHSANALSDTVRGIGFLVLAVGMLFLVLAVGMLFVGVGLFRRSRARNAADSAQDDLSLHVSQLARERDLLRSAWLWYVGPTVPGFLLIYGGTLLDRGADPAVSVIAGGATAAFLAVVVVLNRRAAVRVQREIDNLCDMQATSRESRAP